MKKLFLGMLAIVAMIATSCVQDQSQDLGVNLGETVSVSFNVGTATRAYSDGSLATNLQWAVYDKDGVLLPALQGLDNAFNGQKNFAIDLAKGDTYSMVFWAYADNAPYSLDLATKTVTVDYTIAKSNDEKRDAFYAYTSFTVEANTVVSVQLKRPFAQLNIGASDFATMANAGRDITLSKVVVDTYTTLNLASGEVEGAAEQTFDYANLPTEAFVVNPNTFGYLAMNYVLVGNGAETVDVEIHFAAGDAENVTYSDSRTVGSVPVQRNYRTNIYGKLLTTSVDVEVEIEPEFGGDYGIDNDGNTYAKVDTNEEFVAAFSNEEVDIIILDGDINLNDLFAGVLSRAEDTTDPSLTINAGKTLTLDLNGKKLSAVTVISDNDGNGTISANNDNQIIFNVLGTLTVKNGDIEYEHKGENMGWSASTSIFSVTAGGVLNLNGVTAKNLGGSDMAFVAHLNNWGEVTLNVENCTLESTYVPVRVFNSGPDMNNVTIKNSTLNGVSAAFWVHNYTVADFGTEAKAESQKALLNFNIYNQDNTFSPDVNGIRYGFTNSIRTDARGITKAVSEDGTVVTLGYFFDDNKGLVRRGVAGDEENTTIKKVIVEEGIATLYDRTFRRYYALEEVVLPSTLTTIGAAGSGVFQSCTNLKNIVIPESVTVLGKGSFQECSSLESINIPAGVTRIEADALRASGLVEVEFHEGVTYFGAQAFRDCKQLTKVVIKAPEFTMEGNTFGIMAAPFTPMTIEVATPAMKEYVESKLTAHAKTYITVVGPQVVTTVAELKEAMVSGKTVVIGADIENETIKLPAELNNFTLRAAAGVVLKNTTISAADGNAYHYENLTFDGLTFENGRILLTGWRNGEEVIKNLTITNCVFQNLNNNDNSAPVHINKDAAEAVENFTFTNNVINGATGGSKSGVYAQVTGKVVFENNVINNVAFRPYVIQITTDDGIADSFSVKGNTFSESSVGRAQGLGNNAEGTDTVQLVVSGNIFKDITGSQQICYWNFNAATTTADLSKNYYSIDIEANPSRIYYNAAATSVEDLKAMGVYPYYTALNADGTIDLNSLKQAE